MTDLSLRISVPEGDGIFGGVDELAYHADRGSLSSSGAKLLLPPSCPAKFREAQDNPPAPKREFDVGHLVHRLILGKGAEVVQIEAPDYRGKDAREARDRAHADGMTPALRHEVGAAQRMADAVRAHRIAGPLFTAGDAEMSLYADDPATGVRLRGRVDWMWYGASDGRLWLIDVKTALTSEPRGFARKAADLGYVMQADWYVSLLTALKLAVDPVFVFVVVEKTPPFVVTVVEYDAESMAEGHRRNREAINLYAQCVESGRWPGYADDGIVPISLPPWAFSRQTINDLLEIN